MCRPRPRNKRRCTARTTRREEEELREGKLREEELLEEGIRHHDQDGVSRSGVDRDTPTRGCRRSRPPKRRGRRRRRSVAVSGGRGRWRRETHVKFVQLRKAATLLRRGHSQLLFVGHFDFEILTPTPPHTTRHLPLLQRKVHTKNATKMKFHPAIVLQISRPDPTPRRNVRLGH